MEILDSVSCSNVYTDAATIEGVYGSSGGYFSVTGADVFAELAFGVFGQEQWTREFHVPVGNGILAPGTAGVRFRNYAAGSIAVVSAGLSDTKEPPIELTAGGQASASVSSQFTSLGYYNVKNYGALGDGATDDTAAIQAAINAACHAGGGIVWFPPGSPYYVLNGTLSLVDCQNVRLIGVASGLNPYGLTSGVRLVRNVGTGPMLNWYATVVTGDVLQGCGIEFISFEGGGLATTGLYLADIYGGVFRHIHVRECTTVCLDISTTNTGAGGTQACIFEGLALSARGTASANGICLRLRSAGVVGGSNVSINVFTDVFIDHNNGVGLDMGDCDSNYFYGLTINRPTGTGNSVLLRGANTANNCRGNVFHNIEAYGPIYAQATGFSQPSTFNTFYYLDNVGNAGPTIEPGAGVLWISYTGAYFLDVAYNQNTSGALRLKSNQSVWSRNNAGSGDVELFKCDAQDRFRMVSAALFVGQIALFDGVNVDIGSTTGTRFGNGNTQKIGFFGSTPIVQPSATGTATGYAAGATAATFHSDDTYTGTLGATAYTINGLVTALKTLGIIKA